MIQEVRLARLAVARTRRFTASEATRELRGIVPGQRLAAD
jgi:hypothetical protein